MRSADAIALGLSGLPANAAVAAFDWARARAVLERWAMARRCRNWRPHRPRAPPTRVDTPRRGVDLPARILQLLAEVIGADDVQALDSTVPLVALGLDSLNACVAAADQDRIQL